VPVILFTAVLLVAPSAASAQPLASFENLGLRVNLGDSLRIENASRERISGRLTRLTRDEITISTDSGEQRFTRATVRDVAVRRSSRRRGVLIGAGVAAAAGALAACVPADRSECADGPIIMGALGAGVGLALGGLVARTTTVYVSPIDMPPSPLSTQPPGPLETLALRIDLNDWIRVEDRSGTRISGRLMQLTGEEMTIETDDGPKRFTAASVRAVAVRSYPLGKGALIGAGVFTVLAVTAPACRSNPDCVPIAAGAVGAGVGLTIGALIPATRIVYPAPKASLSLSPAFIRRGIGIRADLRW
jgi:hypothetical protein